MRNPLLLPSVALAAGIAVAAHVPFSPREGIVALLVLSCAAAVAGWSGSKRTALPAVIAAVFFAGCLTAALHRRAARPELDVTSEDVAILSGCVVEPAVLSEDREQFTLELEPGARARVSLYAPEGGRLPEIRYGQRIELDAKVRRTHNFRNPGAFDYEGYLARQDIYWTASARSSSVRILPGSCGWRLDAAVSALRCAAMDRLAALYRGDRYRTAMMQGLLIGESSGLERVWTEDFRRTGTYHALVISGTHVAVVAGVLLFLMRVLFVPAGVSMLVTVAASWLYAAVAGFQAPVLRSAAGFTLFVIARFFFRRPRVLNILAAVAAGFLVVDPEQLFDASFQLSFLSVAAIGALASPFLDRFTTPYARGARALSDPGRDPHLDARVARFRVELRLLAETASLWTRVPGRICLGALSWAARVFFYAAEVFCLSAAVQFGLALPMAIYFHRLSITGLSANLLVLPLLSAAVPLGFLAVFSGWSAPAVVAGWLLTMSRLAAAWHVQWEPGWRIPGPPLWLALVLAGSTLLLSFGRNRAGRYLAACAAGVSLALVVWHPFPPKVEPRVLELTAIDVGQAESVFVAFPDGKLMLVDGGGFPASGRQRRPRIDIGEDVVSPYLWTRSVRRLDTVVLSHPHEDHAAGLPAVIDNFRPRELWTARSVADVPLWRRVRDRAAANGVRVVPLSAGLRFQHGGATVEVLWPDADHAASAGAPNNDSLVFRLTYGGLSFLLTGDIERETEYELLDRAAVAPAAVLMVGHHGSRTSSTGPFLELVNPVFAVISAGYENSFRNPNPDVLKRLEQLRATVLRTDLRGLISIRTDGRRLRVE